MLCCASVATAKPWQVVGMANYLNPFYDTQVRILLLDKSVYKIVTWCPALCTSDSYHRSAGAVCMPQCS
jgi:hypothetical protein